MKTHDADLCDRIRELEERVRELESRPYHHCGFYCNHWYPQTTVPQWTWTPWVSNESTITVDTSTTPTITYSSVQPN